MVSKSEDNKNIISNFWIINDCWNAICTLYRGESKRWLCCNPNDFFYALFTVVTFEPSPKGMNIMMNIKSIGNVKLKKSIKILIIFNLICYFSYFIYTCVDQNMTIHGGWVITAFLPYFLVIFSAFLIGDNEKGKIFRIEAIIDLILRIAALFINFSLHGLEKYSLRFNLTVIVVLVLFLLNIYIEKRMYIKAESINYISKDPKYYEYSFEDRLNLNDMISSVRSDLAEIPILMIILTSLTGFKRSSSSSYVSFFGILDSCFLGYLLYHSYNLILLYYKDKSVTRNVFLKQNTSLLITIMLCSIFDAFRVLGYSSGIDDFLKIVAMLPLYTYFTLRSKRALKVKKMMIAKAEWENISRNTIGYQ